jgi:hypothetical protein
MYVDLIIILRNCVVLQWCEFQHHPVVLCNRDLKSFKKQLVKIQSTRKTLSIRQS